MAHDSRAVANEILKRAWQKGFEPTQIDIQKITYFLHGHHLVDQGQPLVNESFEALHYGPVQRSLLDAFSKYGEEPIRELATKFDPVRRTYTAINQITDNVSIETIETYLDRYLGISSFELVEMTHAQGTPWSLTMQSARNAVNLGMRISDDLIGKCFEGYRAA